jgi:hypothetical protein
MDKGWMLNSQTWLLEGANQVVTRVTPEFPVYDRVVLEWKPSFSRGRIYRLHLHAMKDISGQIAVDTSFLFALPERPDSCDVCLNELMYNPPAGEYDFVELVNRSARCLDLSAVWLSSRADDGSLREGYRLSDKPIPALPGSYWVLSEAPDSLIKRYNPLNPSHFLKLSSMPSLPDEAGHPVLVRTDGQVLDEVAYRDNWQMVLMSRTEGVSLEKIRPDFPSSLASSWLSASSSCDYATPGSPNSRSQVSVAAGEKWIALSQVWMTPDGDGKDDLICIQLTVPEPGCVTVELFDGRGRRIKRLLSNAWLTAALSFCWNGSSDNDSLLPSGKYILLATYTTVTGRSEQVRKVVSIL